MHQNEIHPELVTSYTFNIADQINQIIGANFKGSLENYQLNCSSVILKIKILQYIRKD